MANADLLRRLLATFRLEGEERLESMSAALLALEQQPEDQPRAEIVEGLFREAHSLKGAARAVNLGGIESLCQALEGVLAEIKRGRVELSRALLELLHHTVDTLGGMLEPAVAAETDVDGLVVQLGRASAGSLRSSPAATASAPASGPASGPAPAGTSGAVVPGWPAGATGRAAGGTVRISVAKLEAVMRQVESLLAPRLAAGQLATDIGEARGSLIELKKSRARLQPRLRQIERRLPAVQGELPELPLLLEYLDDEHDRLKVLEERLATLARTAERDVRQLTSLVNGLHEDTKELQLMPCSALLEMFPRLVRELSREQGKEVRLDIEGAEVEVDRRLLEELRDPLTHLLRNAVDHGIENAEVRRERQKPATGRISIVIEQRDSNKIELLLRDDGAGIDMERLRAAVVESGIADADVLVAMEEQALVEFAFHSGVTTSPLITDLSGRGLGLTIVREKVERLGGTVEVSFRPGQGTTFRLVLPLTLATFHGLLVRAGGHLYVIPAASVERVLRFSAADVRGVQNRETFVVNGQPLALVGLARILGLAPLSPGDQAGHREAVLLGGAERIAFEVDEIIGEQEVLIRPLGPQLARVANVSGATVLGNGRVVPVLNVPDLLLSATLPSGAGSRSGASVSEQHTPSSILVVEDSITSRSLLKGILESAGYQVTTAVDGIDALTTLKTDPVDLIVSDIDMPRMNGLELTAEVRAAGELADLPVILVTSLSTPEDRERGVEVGANAYIVKSNFDQSSLLEAVQRLIG